MAIKIKIMTFNISAEDLCSNNNIVNVTHIIKQINPDIIGIQETCCYDENNKIYTDISSYKIIANELSYFFYKQKEQNCCILSKYPVIESSNNDYGVVVKISDFYFGIFNIHLTDEPYQPYQLGGVMYGSPEINPLIDNEKSAIYYAKKTRMPTIKNVLNDILLLETKRNPIGTIIMGDFNEPSHRDWTEEMAVLKHHPIKVAYPNVKYIEEHGFVDSYRFIYPNPALNNGFTWPTIGTYSDEKLSKNDRIDYILMKSNVFKIVDAKIIGEINSASDIKFETWPSDHRAYCITIVLNNFQNKYSKYEQKLNNFLSLFIE